MISWSLVRAEFTQQLFPSVGVAVVTAWHLVFPKLPEIRNVLGDPVPGAIYGWC